MKLKIGENNIGYINSNFQEWFGDIEVKESTATLTSEVLKRDMTDWEIMEELKPQEVELGDIVKALSCLDRENSNIFYVRDTSGVLRAVVVYWFGDGWDVGARSVEFPREWPAGARVFSRNSDIKKIAPLKYSDSSLVDKINEIIKVVNGMVK